MVLMTGGSGLLGSYIINNCNPDLLHPTSVEMDICCTESVMEYFSSNDISLVIHAAAYTDVKAAQQDFITCSNINIVGTFNILRECVKRNIKIVFISTDAVFDGISGNYTNDSYINPISKYAKTKASAEIMVQCYKNSMIIRTSFFGEDFPYQKAFTDQFTTKDYIDIMAPLIYKQALSNTTGIKHVFSKKRSLYELAKLRKPDVIPIKRSEISLDFSLPFDLSLK